MTEFPVYHKINSIQRRHVGGPNDHEFTGEWADPVYGQLQDIPWVVREKIDGCNLRIKFDFDLGGTQVLIGGRSDKAQIPKPLQAVLDATFLDTVFIRLAEEKFYSGLDSSVTFYGEGFGAGIQKGLKYGPVGFILFDIRIGHMWLQEDAITEIAKSMGLQRVPIYDDISTLRDALYMVSSGDLISHFPKYGEAEGIVAVPSSGLLDRRGHRIIAKIKGVDFPGRHG